MCTVFVLYLLGLGESVPEHQVAMILPNKEMSKSTATPKKTFHVSTLYRSFKAVHFYDLDSTKQIGTIYFILKIRKLSLSVRNSSGTFWQNDNENTGFQILSSESYSKCSTNFPSFRNYTVMIFHVYVSQKQSLWKRISVYRKGESQTQLKARHIFWFAY